MFDEITDKHLLAYLDGEAESRIVTQIEESTELRNRAKELAKLQNKLLTKLYRRMCPDSIELGEFHLGLLTKKQARAIEKHVAECPHCTQELAQLRKFIGEEDTTLEPGLSEQLNVLVARLVSGVQKGGAGQTPAFALRGDEGETIIYEADGIQVVLDIQESADSSSHKSVLGLITGLKGQGYQASLLLEGKVIADSQVDSVGNFVLQEISTGEYDLIIRGPDIEIQINKLRV